MVTQSYSVKNAKSGVDAESLPETSTWFDDSIPYSLWKETDLRTKSTNEKSEKHKLTIHTRVKKFHTTAVCGVKNVQKNL